MNYHLGLALRKGCSYTGFGVALWQLGLSGSIAIALLGNGGHGAVAVELQKWRDPIAT